MLVVGIIPIMFQELLMILNGVAMHRKDANWVLDALWRQMIEQGHED